MSEHERMQTLLGARHDLSASERAALDAHLENCAPCRELAQEYDMQDAFLRALPLPAPSPALREQVYARVRRTPSRWHAVLRGGLLLGMPSLITVLAIVLIAARIHPPAGGAAANRAAAFGREKAAPLTPGTGLYAFPLPSATAQIDQAAQHSSVNPPAAAPASPLIPPGGRRSDTVSEGIRLSLIVPQPVYPRNALVPVETEVQNRTSVSVWVYTGTPHDCGTPGPIVEAIDRSGRPVDPLPGRPIPNCPLLFPGPHDPGLLRPGQIMRTHAYVVLLTDRLRAVATVTAYHGCDPRIRISCRGTVMQVVGKPLTLTVRSGHAPRITLHGLPPTSFSLVPATRRPPLLWYQGWYTCGPGPGQDWSMSDGGAATVFGPGNSAPLRFFSDCSSKTFVLHLVAGHPGQPVAFVTERRGHMRP